GSAIRSVHADGSASHPFLRAGSDHRSRKRAPLRRGNIGGEYGGSKKRQATAPRRHGSSPMEAGFMLYAVLSARPPGQLIVGALRPRDSRKVDQLPCACPARYGFGGLDALSLLIRPLHLHGVAGDLLEAPGADVADFTVHVVVPPGAGNRIGDRLAQLVGTGPRHRVQRRKAAQTASAGRVGHHRVVRLAGVVVIAAVALAGTS